MYASPAYLSRHGEPDTTSGCPGHHLITTLDEDELPGQAGWIADIAGRARVLLKTDNREALFWSALQSGGLALLPQFRGDKEPALRRLETPSPAPGAEVWLAVHEDVRHMPRIRVVLDCIAETFRRNTNTLAAVPDFQSRRAEVAA